MTQFFVATVVSYLVLSLCKVIINLYLNKYQDKEDELNNSLFFNAAAVFLLMSYAICFVSITVLASLIVKQYIL